MPFNFDEIIEECKKSAREIAKDFKNPDDDWAPVLLVHGNTPVMLPLFFSSDAEKDLVTNLLIPAVIKKANGWMATLVLSAWLVTIKNPNPGEPIKWDELPGPRPSQHPDRIEVLQITAATKDRLEIWQAKILRDDEQPPILSEWEKLGEGKEAELSGRFVEALRKGFE